MPRRMVEILSQRQVDRALLRGRLPPSDGQIRLGHLALGELPAQLALGLGIEPMTIKPEVSRSSRCTTSAPGRSACTRA